MLRVSTADSHGSHFKDCTSSLEVRLERASNTLFF
jgi:hypothetical protein